MINLIVTCFASDSLTISAISIHISHWLERDLDHHHRAHEIHGKTTHQVACLVPGMVISYSLRHRKWPIEIVDLPYSMVIFQFENCKRLEKRLILAARMLASDGFLGSDLQQDLHCMATWPTAVGNSLVCSFSVSTFRCKSSIYPSIYPLVN